MIVSVKTATTIEAMETLGIPFPWPSATIPDWALEMDGQAIAAITYPGLAALYGANLPDMRDRCIVGKSATIDLLATGGEKTHLLTGAESGVPVHTHPNGASGASGATPNAGGGVGPASSGNNSAANAESAHNNMQPYIGLHWIVRKF